MEHFDARDPQSIALFIRDSLSRHDLMALATVGVDLNPWVVCVSMSYDKDCNLIWKSSTQSIHSQNISRHSQVSICIFSRNSAIGDFGMYTFCEAHAVEDETELTDCLAAKYVAKNLPVPSFQDFLGDNPKRIYKAVIKEAWVTDDRHQKVPVDLGVLRKLLHN